MNDTHNDWDEEQERVEDVTSKVNQRIKQLEVEVGRVKTDVVEIRKHFWDDVTVNFSNPDDIADTLSSMKQQAEVLSEQERRYRQSNTALSKLSRVVLSPYFGRIDFAMEGESNTEKIYLGISSFQDGEMGPFLIYDWRAPISSLYYDHSPGEADYATPMGQIKGLMSLKRQFMIRDRLIHLMFDTGVTIGDEMLQKVLSRNSDSQMKSIVATIQKEQNQIIRNSQSRMLIVQGSAGSGKTSAALQRVAYLLYKHRETLKADQIVLFSPNTLFNSYVSTVLPELGEENMQQTTLQEYLVHRFSGRFQLEDPFTQLEYILTMEASSGYQARLAGIGYKSSSDFINVISAYRDSLIHKGMLFKAITFREAVIVSISKMQEKFYSYSPHIRLPNRIELMKDWLLDQLSAFGEREIYSGWVEDEIELLRPEDYNRAFKELRSNQDDFRVSFNDFDKEKENLARLIVKKQLNPLKKEINLLCYVDVSGLYMQLFKNKSLFLTFTNLDENSDNWSEICQQTIEKLERSEISYEDATPFLFLQELVQGFETNGSVRHVFIDEVQDYSPFQIEFLKRLFPRSKMTALGDFNQAIFSHHSALSELNSIIESFGEQQTEIIRLNQSYRSTREIVEFTRGMVPGGQAIMPFNRSGDKPQVTLVSSIRDLHKQIEATLTFLRSEGFESIGIICKTATESADAFLALNEHQNLLHITKHTPSYEKGILILPAYLAKGVEFDAVIIYNGSQEQYSRARELKLFYTACTRAMHHLQIYSLGKPSTFITDQALETYLYLP